MLLVFSIPGYRMTAVVGRLDEEQLGSAGGLVEEYADVADACGCSATSAFLFSAMRND